MMHVINKQLNFVFIEFILDLANYQFFFRVFVLKMMKNSTLSTLKQILKLKIHKLVFLNILHNVDAEIRP